MTPWPVINHALIYGGILSASLVVMLLTLLWANAEVMLGDYPPDIRAKHGPMSARTKRQKTLVSIFFGLVAFVPGFFVLPGTEGMAGYKDYWFHFRGFLIGCVGILAVSAVLAGAVAAVF